MVGGGKIFFSLCTGRLEFSKFPTLNILQKSVNIQKDYGSFTSRAREAVVDEAVVDEAVVDEVVADEVVVEVVLAYRSGHNSGRSTNEETLDRCVHFTMSATTQQRVEKAEKGTSHNVTIKKRMKNWHRKLNFILSV